MRKKLTVGELKQFLTDFADNLPITVTSKSGELETTLVLKHTCEAEANECLLVIDMREGGGIILV